MGNVGKSFDGAWAMPGDLLDRHAEAERYTCDDGYYWVCKQCFNECKRKFGLVLVQGG